MGTTSRAYHLNTPYNEILKICDSAVRKEQPNNRNGNIITGEYWFGSAFPHTCSQIKEPIYTSYAEVENVQCGKNPAGGES